MPKWLLLAVATVVLCGIWGFLSRVVSNSMSAAQSQALSVFGLLPVFAWLGFSKRLAGTDKVRGAAYAFGGGLLGGIGNLSFYYILNRGAKAATVIPLTSLYPVVTVVLAVLVLKERLNAAQKAGVVLALTAIYLFNATEQGDFINVWLAYALVPIGLWGLAGLLQKMCTSHISSELSTLWFLGGYIPIAIVIFLTQKLDWQITTKAWSVVIGLGLFLGLGNLTLLAAYECKGKASVITPLSGLYPIVTVPLAIWFLDEKISGRELAGITLALVSVVALSYEKKSGVADAGLVV
jgi:drug/metabolite transporter (DMT)-like permease